MIIINRLFKCWREYKNEYFVYFALDWGCISTTKYLRVLTSKEFCQRISSNVQTWQGSNW